MSFLETDPSLLLQPDMLVRLGLQLLLLCGSAFFSGSETALFLVFGGLIFLIIGLRFVLVGPDAVEQLYGKAEHVSGSIAMPFMIGPGTVHASVLAGARQPPVIAILSIAAGLAAALLCVLALRFALDRVRSRQEELFARYVDVVGRVSAIIMGTIAVQMIFNGLGLWLDG